MKETDSSSFPDIICISLNSEHNQMQQCPARQAALS